MEALRAKWRHVLFLVTHLLALNCFLSCVSEEKKKKNARKIWIFTLLLFHLWKLFLPEKTFRDFFCDVCKRGEKKGKTFWEKMFVSFFVLRRTFFFTHGFFFFGGALKKDDPVKTFLPHDFSSQKHGREINLDKQIKITSDPRGFCSSHRVIASLPYKPNWACTLGKS